MRLSLQSTFSVHTLRSWRAGSESGYSTRMSNNSPILEEGEGEKKEVKEEGMMKGGRGRDEIGEEEMGKGGVGYGEMREGEVGGRKSVKGGPVRER